MYSLGSQAGLFSAVTSAFILDVQSQLQPDTGEETAALLRVLIYKIDNTTFGNDTPTLPQWTGPPYAIVQVQAILYASLAVSLLSALLAVLGKQWLNQYASTDMRGTAIERSQNRQRKLDGIIAWYFDHVMESLPLMLQIALLLLGCALSRYLWDINIIVASVVLSVTSFGVAFYVFIVVAGTSSESCPYQTPGARILRHILRRTLVISGSSECWGVLVEWRREYKRPWYSTGNIHTSLVFPLYILVATAVDVYGLGRAILRSLVAFVRMVYHRVMSTSPKTRALDQQAITLGLQCISWILQTSLDKAVHLSALKHLATMTMPAEFNPVIVTDCFNVFIGCISKEVVIVRGLEQLAAVSAVCFLRTFRHLSVTDPTSSILKDVCRQSRRVFPSVASFDPPASDDLTMYFVRESIWCALCRQLRQYGPSTQEHVLVTREMAEAAQVEYQRTQHIGVPYWNRWFAYRSLSLDPLPPMSIVANCLLIIAINLGCVTSDTGSTTSENERCVHVLQIIVALTLNQCTS